MTKPIAVMNWSGGKDSALALNRVLSAGELDVRYLLTTVNSHWQRVSMHGVRRELLRAQADATGIELIEVLLPEMPSMEVYEAEMNRAMNKLMDAGVTHSIFGDIFLADLRKYREAKLKEKGMTAVFPLWQIPTPDLIEEFFSLKFGAVTVCTDADKMGEEFCGRIINEAFVSGLPDGVDVCGENGEYHSFVFDAPFYKAPVKFEIGEKVHREYETNGAVANQFWYCDLLPRQ